MDDVLSFYVLPSGVASIPAVSCTSESRNMYSKKYVKKFLKNCEEGKLDEVENAISKHPSIVHEKNVFGWTSLHWASSKGQLKVVRLLLQAGANIDQKNNDGRTSLYYASFGGQVDMVNELLKRGANIDHKDIKGWTSLHSASRGGDLEVIKVLLQAGANLDHRDNDAMYHSINELVKEGDLQKIKNFVNGNELKEEAYLKKVKTVGLVQSLEKKSRIQDVEEILGYLLLLSSKNRDDYLVTEICNLILHHDVEAFSRWREKKRIKQSEQEHKEMVGNIIHITETDGHSVMYYINMTNNLKNGLELLYTEKYAHGDRQDALKCIRNNAGNFMMDAWLIDTYKLVDPSEGMGRKISAMMAVSVQIFLSIIFFGFDYISDLILCIEYWFLAFDTQNAITNSTCTAEIDYQTCLTNEIQLSNMTDDLIPRVVRLVENVTCSKSRKWTSCIEFDVETTQEKYITAFYIMLMTIIVSTSTYVWITYKTKVDVKGWKKVLLKPFWPMLYLLDEYKLSSGTDKELTESLKEKESSWKFLKSVENGIENYIQFFIQLFLLAPYISFLQTLSSGELLELGLSNVFGMFNLSLTCNENGGYSALGKLFLSILSLSYGIASRNTSRRGQTLSQTILNLVLWLSYILLSFVRVMAIFSLLAIETPVVPVLLFASLHFVLVFMILMKTKEFTFEKNVKSIWRNEKRRIENELSQTVGVWEGRHTAVVWRHCCAKVLAETFPYILSCMGSHTITINFHDVKRGPTFFKQFMFQCLVAVENIILLSLPIILTNIYPTTDCFKTSSSQLILAGTLWFFGICLLVVYYMLIHPMSDVNGSELFKLVSQLITSKKRFLCKEEEETFDDTLKVETEQDIEVVEKDNIGESQGLLEDEGPSRSIMEYPMSFFQTRADVRHANVPDV